VTDFSTICRENSNSVLSAQRVVHHFLLCLCT